MARRKGNKPRDPWYDDSCLRTKAWQTLDGFGTVQLVERESEVVVDVKPMSKTTLQISVEPMV